MNEPEQFNETAGKGVNAKIDGDEVLVGREVWLKETKSAALMIRRWIWMRLKGIVWFTSQRMGSSWGG
uniref:Uncharacterized protein n=1 Tax=uncultured marine bacterium MedDCM-OCT-S08-C1605 TaxID=743072 RepID=D6PDV6_9BACT|nr:hypothetical protein [uncultured marine bacterium MedDCM-OCT-S08-C1605]